MFRSISLGFLFSAHYLLLLAFYSTYGRECYGGVLGENATNVKENQDGIVCGMSLHMPCLRKPKIAIFASEDKRAAGKCFAGMFALKCICDADLCNGDIHLFKKMWESSRDYSKNRPHTRCFMRAYYAIVPTTTTELITTSTTWTASIEDSSGKSGNQTGSDENDTGITSYSGQLGKLHVSLKTKPTKGPEAQLNRKERKHYMAHKKQTDLTRDILLIGVIVILSIILVGLVVFGIALLLKGRDRSKKKPSKKKKKERKKKAFRR